MTTSEEISQDSDRHVSGENRISGENRTATRAVFYTVSLLIIAGLLAALLPSAGSRSASPRSACKNNLKQIGLALHNYHDTYGSFPPLYTVDDSGQPLHSWRTLILPFIDQAPLYETIDLSKPWDDPANSEISQTVVPVYSCPSTTFQDERTVYMAVVSRRSPWAEQEIKTFDDVPNIQDSLMVVETVTVRAVPWMSPQDVDENEVLWMIGRDGTPHKGGVHGLLVDGRVTFLSTKSPADDLRYSLSNKLPQKR